MKSGVLIISEPVPGNEGNPIENCKQQWTLVLPKWVFSYADNNEANIEVKTIVS